MRFAAELAARLRSGGISAQLLREAGAAAAGGSRPWIAAVDGIADAMSRGDTLAQALWPWYRRFDRAYRTLVVYGELGGTLSFVLEELGEIDA